MMIYMDPAAIAAAIGVPAALLATAVVLRQRRRRRVPFGRGPGGRSGGAGVREPRRPLVPAGSGAIAVDPSE